MAAVDGEEEHVGEVEAVIAEKINESALTRSLNRTNASKDTTMVCLDCQMRRENDFGQLSKENYLTASDLRGLKGTAESFKSNFACERCS